MAKAKSKSTSVRVTLRKSTIGEKPKTRATVEGLGLRRIGQTVTHIDSPSLRGMTHKVSHLVEVDDGDLKAGDLPKAGDPLKETK